MIESSLQLSDTVHVHSRAAAEIIVTGRCPDVSVPAFHTAHSSSDMIRNSYPVIIHVHFHRVSEPLILWRVT